MSKDDDFKIQRLRTAYLIHLLGAVAEFDERKRTPWLSTQPFNTGRSSS